MHNESICSVSFPSSSFSRFSLSISKLNVFLVYVFKRQRVRNWAARSVLFVSLSLSLSCQRTVPLLQFICFELMFIKLSSVKSMTPRNDNDFTWTDFPLLLFDSFKCCMYNASEPRSAWSKCMRASCSWSRVMHASPGLMQISSPSLCAHRSIIKCNFLGYFTFLG